MIRAVTHLIAICNLIYNLPQDVGRASPAEKEDLAKLELPEVTTQEQAVEAEIITNEPPSEITEYQELKAISHLAALKDNLKFLIQPESRIDYEKYITEKSRECNKLSLTPSNWQEIPDLTVANIYWYFKNIA